MHFPTVADTSLSLAPSTAYALLRTATLNVARLAEYLDGDNDPFGADDETCTALAKALQDREAIRRAAQEGDAIPRATLSRVRDEAARPRRATPRAGVYRRSPLTDRQLDMLVGLAEGKSYKQIAHESALSVSTVRTHVHNAYARLGVCDRAQAVLVAVREGWIMPSALGASA